jgi:hypothetical protein
MIRDPPVIYVTYLYGVHRSQLCLFVPVYLSVCARLASSVAAGNPLWLGSEECAMPLLGQTNSGPHTGVWGTDPICCFATLTPVQEIITPPIIHTNTHFSSFVLNMFSAVNTWALTGCPSGCLPKPHVWYTRQMNKNSWTGIDTYFSLTNTHAHPLSV